MNQPKGFQPFDLAAPTEILVPRYTPLRVTPEEHRRRAAEMAEGRRLTAEKFAAAQAAWRQAVEQLADDPRALAVLNLHEPEQLGGHNTCAECASYDREGLSMPDWPCATYSAVTEEGE